MIPHHARPSLQSRDSHPSAPPEPPIDPCISTEQLSVRYGSHQALEGVSLSIQPKKITALVGPSGSGKTSFLMCLNRLTDLIPNCHVSGSIRLGNLDVRSSKTNVLQLRRRIGMIFQKPNPFPFSIRRNFVVPLKEHGVATPQEHDHLIQHSLTQVGLWEEVKDRLDSPALSLSGGQQQRLCIARALVLSPEILLMDEPCSALDPLSSGVVEDLIVKFKERYTVVIVTHNLAQARRIANFIALFWAQDSVGHLIEHGPTRQLVNHPQHELTTAYLLGERG